MFQTPPTVVKNILIINALMFIASMAIGWPFYDVMAGHYFMSPKFEPWQIITHMFMHGGFTHILFNMFAVYMFGAVLEKTFGPKRFLVFYMVSGLGAFFLHFLVVHLQVGPALEALNPQQLELLLSKGHLLGPREGFVDEAVNSANQLYNGSVVGASGAVFGILVGFAMLYPDTRLMLLFPPIPIKAKYFVLGYAAIEVYLAVQNSPNDNIAHFAHIGGALFGYLMLKIWQKKGIRF